MTKGKKKEVLKLVITNAERIRRRTEENEKVGGGPMRDNSKYRRGRKHRGKQDE